ncbi:MAG: NUDIX hydrolase [Bacilli bacterium]
MKLINSLVDDQYPKANVYHARISARAICINDKGEIGLTHLLADDKFGHRDYYELPGGGKKLGESVLVSAIREMKEELGVEVSLLTKLGVVHDFYNLINQENYSYYYLFKVTSEGTNHLEPREAGLIDKIVWIPLKKAIELYELQMKIKGVGLLVARRELPILKLAAKSFDKRMFTK